MKTVAAAIGTNTKAIETAAAGVNGRLDLLTDLGLLAMVISVLALGGWLVGAFLKMIWYHFFQPWI
jgi:hypothetical protein